MHVVSHQAVCKEANPEAFHSLAQKLQVPCPVSNIAKNLAPLDTSSYDVVESPRKLDPRLPSHRNDIQRCNTVPNPFGSAEVSPDHRSWVPLGPPVTSSRQRVLLAVSGHGWLLVAGARGAPEPPQDAALRFAESSCKSHRARSRRMRQIAFRCHMGTSLSATNLTKARGPGGSRSRGGKKGESP